MSDKGRAHLLDERLFRGAFLRERKRADRSDRPLALLLVGMKAPAGSESASIWRRVVDAISAAKRETDVMGWFERRTTLGLILPDAPIAESGFVVDFQARVWRELAQRLDPKAIALLSIDVHAHRGTPSAAAMPSVDPFLASPARDVRRVVQDVAKRLLDVAGSAALLALLAPLFLVVAALVKLTSSGPILYRQQRVGQMMKPFRILKFRTMHQNANDAIHHQFVTSFIKSGPQAQEAGRKGVFKITNDPRVTRVGRVLRKTSLDELPQLWNVLRGDMSLVGPRPPIQYEVDQYQAWHRRRVLEAKPGITGLWQVAGRSRTTFDDMVRLDLRYAKDPTLWTDVKILLATPGAIIAGKGAC
jgi:lipopolysaccharide/colanic/teichoic acid biosynthesis glycosyltransferase